MEVSLNKRRKKELTCNVRRRSQNFIFTISQKIWNVRLGGTRFLRLFFVEY